MSSYTPTIDKAALEFAEEHLGETGEIRDSSVKEITDWIIATKSNCEFNIKTDYYWILSFLRGCKFDIEKTKTKILSNAKLRAETPEWYRNCDALLPEINDLLQRGTNLPLRGRDAERRVVIIIRVGAHLPDRHKQNDVMKVYNMIFELILKEVEEATIYGLIAVLDMRDYTFRHILNVKPSMIRKSATVWQTSCFRPQGIHIFYAPAYISVALNIFKQLLSKKIRDRIYVHNWSTNISDIIPKDILPMEYGGTAGNVEELSKYWLDKCLNLREWFIENEKYNIRVTD